MSNHRRTKEELIFEIGGRIRALDIASDLFDDCAAHRLGVNRTDMRVLDILESGGPMSASRLAELNHLSRPATTTVIDRLERAGYARRVENPSDRREVLVEVTDLARRKAMEIFGPFLERSLEVYGRYTVAELEAAIRFLGDSIAMSEEMLERLREEHEDSAGG